MKIVKKNNNAKTVKISKNMWASIGKKSGWLKKAQEELSEEEHQEEIERINKEIDRDLDKKTEEEFEKEYEANKNTLYYVTEYLAPKEEEEGPFQFKLLKSTPMIGLKNAEKMAEELMEKNANNEQYIVYVEKEEDKGLFAIPT